MEPQQLPPQPLPPTPQPSHHNILKPLLIIFVLVLIGAASVFGYQMYLTQQTKQISPPDPDIHPTSIPAIDENIVMYPWRQEEGQLIIGRLQLEIPDGWKYKRTINKYSVNTEYVDIHPFSFENNAQLPAVSITRRELDKSQPEIYSDPTEQEKSYMNDILYTSTKKYNIDISGEKASVLEGIITAPTGPDITCAICYLGKYKEGQKYKKVFIGFEDEVYIIIVDLTDYEKDGNKIVGTFRFLEEESTKDWKTYTNNFDSYSIQYPPAWYLHEAKEKGSGSDISDTNLSSYENVPDPADPNHLRINIVVSPNNSNLSLEQWLKENVSSQPYSSQAIQLAGSNGLIREEDTAEFLQISELIRANTIYIPYKNKIYRILTFPVNSAHKTNLDQILSTFKFTN